jgi:hypothetical protein
MIFRWAVMGNRCKHIMCASTIAAALHGCVAALPPPQVGCLPRPGFFTFFELADTSDLFPPETKTLGHDRRPPVKGIIYTARAGFLDLAHVYNTVLLANDASTLIASGLRNGQRTVQLNDFDDSQVSVALLSPSKSVTDEDLVADRDIQGTSRAIGDCVAFQLMAWHEIVTWFGYQTTRFWTEKPSAFTYEDIVSNNVGVQVFDGIPGELSMASMSSSLRLVLNRLGLVDRSVAAQAVRLVKGRWWGPRLYTRRLVDIGTKDGFMTPWLVPGLGGDPAGDVAKPMSAPCNAQRVGYSVRISPSAELRGRIQKSIPFVPDVIDARADFPFLVDVVRIQVESELGESAIRPD